MPKKTDPTTRTATPETDNRPQIDKFKEAARELETNEDEAAFDRALKKVAKTRLAPKSGEPKAE